MTLEYKQVTSNTATLKATITYTPTVGQIISGAQVRLQILSVDFGNFDSAFFTATVGQPLTISHTVTVSKSPLPSQINVTLRFATTNNILFTTTETATLQPLSTATVPSTPVVTVSNITTTNATVSWTVSSNGGATVTSYNLRLVNLDTNTQTNTPVTTGSELSGSFVYTNLLANTNYRILVSAKNSVGSSNEGFTEFATQSGVNTSMVTTGFSTNIKLQNGNLTGDVSAFKSGTFPSSLNNANLVLFVQLKNSAGQVTLLSNNPFVFGSNAVFTKTLNIFNVTSPITIELFVWDINNQPLSTVETKTITQTVITPPIPSTVTITATPNLNKVFLEWTKPTTTGGEDPLGYAFTVFKTLTGENVFEKALGIAFSFEVTGLEENTEYRVILNARNSAGWGSPPFAETIFKTKQTVDSSVSPTMVTQSIGAFQIDNTNRLKGSINYIAQSSFNSFWYGKTITSLVQIKSESGQVILIKENSLVFTQTERDEVINIDEAVGATKVIVDFFVWVSKTDPRAFADPKTITVERGKDPPPDPPPVPSKPDNLFKILKGGLFATIALSLLGSKGK